MNTYLGIDGGGTKTSARLVDANGKELHTAESGPSNLNAYDEDTVRKSLSVIVQECLEASGQTPTMTCLGIAGVSSSGAKEKLEAILQSLELKNYHIASDAEIALEGAFSGGPGILLIAGTGSICLGKSSDGAIARTGGWGWLADDAGSAAWIGQRALEAAIQQNDGRMPETALRNTLFDQLGIDDNEQISTKLYQPELSRARLGELSKSVLDLALNEDIAAKKIQENALKELEKLIHSTARKLNDKVLKVSLTGGLLTHNPSLRNDLESRLSDFQVQVPELSPLEGAVALARRI